MYGRPCGGHPSLAFWKLGSYNFTSKELILLCWKTFLLEKFI